MKVAVIGGGSSYTPELVEGLLEGRESLPVSQIVLMDPDADRLSITSGLARRMAASRPGSPAIQETTDLREAVEGAKYVVTQMRVGGIPARIEDERLGLRHGLIGQETTGVGGFANALRTIPRVLDVARLMEEVCPDAFLLNFTNPAGIVTEALLRHSSITTIGLCNIPIGIVMDVAKRAACDPADVELDYVGLNHLSWVRRFRVKGEDRTEEILAAFIDDASEEWEDPEVCESMQIAMRCLGMFCNPYLQYFYATAPALAKQQRQTLTRGEEVAKIEKTLFEKYADPERSEKPPELALRGGAHYSTAALALIEAIETDSKSTQIVCCRNNGAVPSLDKDATVEVPAIIGSNGASAIPQPLPDNAILGLLQCMKAFESLTVEAAVTGCRDTALQAMLLHPLMPGAADSRRVLDELLEVNKPYLQGTFFNDAAGVAHGS